MIHVHRVLFEHFVNDVDGPVDVLVHAELDPHHEHNEGLNPNHRWHRDSNVVISDNQSESVPEGV